MIKKYTNFVRIPVIKAKCLYNVTDFYIRQVMTGIKKDAKSLHPNEEEVLNIIRKYLPEYNALRLEYLKK